MIYRDREDRTSCYCKNINNLKLFKDPFLTSENPKFDIDGHIEMEAPPGQLYEVLSFKILRTYPPTFRSE